jgi:hypothetical protein
MTNENKTAWDTKDFVVCETDLGKLRSELKAAEESIPNGYHTHVIEHEAYETVVSSNKLQRMTINELRRQLDEKQDQIAELEALLMQTEKLINAVQQMVSRKALTIFIEEEGHVEEYFRNVEQALLEFKNTK